MLLYTEDVWRPFSGSRMFITGGTGFIGKWLLTAIAAANDMLSARISATVLCRNPRAFLSSHRALSARPEFTWHRGDVRHFALPTGSFPVVIHAATSASEHLNLGQPIDMFDTIVEGTRRVLDFAAARGTEALLLTSSGAVYGRQPLDLLFIPESFNPAPESNPVRSAYTEGKRAAELLAIESGLPVKIARGFAFVGPQLPLDTHFAVGNFVRDALRGGPIVVRGDGTPFRSYLYAADLAIWLLTILFNGRPQRPYNVGSERAVSIAQLAEAVSLVSGKTPVKILQPSAGNATERYVPDTQRARHELGLEAMIPLPDALRRTLAWAGSCTAHTGQPV